MLKYISAMTVVCTKFRQNLSKSYKRCLLNECLRDKLPLQWTYAKIFVCFWRDSPQWARASSYTRFLDHTQRRTAVGRTPLDEWSARFTQHSQQKKSMPPVGFEPTISAVERPQTYALERAATGTGTQIIERTIYISWNRMQHWC